MTESPFTDEQFLRRLTEADPVDRATLPRADAPAAARLLDSILGDADADADAGWTGPTTDPSRLGDRPVTTVLEPVGARRGSWIGRSRGALVAVAAAVAVLVGGVTVLAPDNTTAALADVRAAAATTADAATGHVETTFSLDYTDESGDPSGGHAGTVSGRMVADYAGSDLGLSVQLDSLPDEVGVADLSRMADLGDIRLVDDVAYISQNGEWLAIETGGLLGDQLVQFVDPRSVLGTVQDLTETTEVGQADVDGTATTHYRSVIDLGDESLAQAGWMAVEGMDVQTDGEVTLDLYVDGDGILRRFELTGEIRSADGEPGQGTFEVATSFTDIGADVTIEAPAGATVFDPLASFGDSIGND